MSRPAHGSQERRLLWPVWLLALLTLLAASRAAVDVVLPVVWAGLAACATYPTFRRLERKLPSWLAAIAVLLLLLVIFGTIGAGLYYCTDAFLSHLDQANLRDKRLDIAGQSFSVDDLRKRVTESSSSMLSQLASTAIGSVLMVALATLGLMESGALKRWLQRSLSGAPAARALSVLRQFSSDVRRYLMVRTLLGLLTGSVVAGACWVLGIQLPFVWGITNFLLNYVPTVGSVLGVVPPTLFTLADTGLSSALLALGTVGTIQLVMGNWIDPLLQGKYLEMSPTIVLLAVTFWGWLWGPWGAFIGVPLTLFIARACEHHEPLQAVTSLIVVDVDRSKGR